MTQNSEQGGHSGSPQGHERTLREWYSLPTGASWKLSKFHIKPRRINTNAARTQRFVIRKYLHPHGTVCMVLTVESPGEQTCLDEDVWRFIYVDLSLRCGKRYQRCVSFGGKETMVSGRSERSVVGLPTRKFWILVKVTSQVPETFMLCTPSSTYICEQKCREPLPCKNKPILIKMFDDVLN